MPSGIAFTPRTSLSISTMATSGVTKRIRRMACDWVVPDAAERFDQSGLGQLLEQFGNRRHFEPRALRQGLCAEHPLGAGEAGHDDGVVIGQLADAQQCGGHLNRTKRQCLDGLASIINSAHALHLFWLKGSGTTRRSTGIVTARSTVTSTCDSAKKGGSTDPPFFCRDSDGRAPARRTVTRPRNSAEQPAWYP